MATRNHDTPLTNFGFLEAHDEQLVRLGMLAERYFPDDPDTSLLKLRQLAELLAQLVASKVGIYTSRQEAQYDLLRRLQDQSILPREISQLFDEVRRAGNAAGHAISGDHRTALAALRITWQLGVWFHRTFADPVFKSGPFVPPVPPQDESAELRAELASELVHLGSAVMALGGTIHYFTQAVFNYPTLGEAYKYAAYDARSRMKRLGLPGAQHAQVTAVPKSA